MLLTGNRMAAALFRGMSLRRRILVLPLLGLALIGALSFAYWSEYSNQTGLLKRVAEHDLTAYDRFEDVSVNLTAQHLAIYDLLLGVNRPRDGDALHDIGKRRLESIFAAMQLLDAAQPLARQGDSESAARREALVSATQQYRTAIVSAVSLSSVDIGRASGRFTRANTDFVSMNVAFTQFLAVERSRIRAEISARVVRGEQVTGFVIVAGLAAAALLLGLSFVGSRFLSRSIEHQIDALVELGGRAGTHFTITGADELDRVDQAVKAFGHVLQQLSATRAELEQRVLDRTRELAEANTRLERLATHDVLTHLPNRGLFDDRLHVAIAATKRQRGLLAVMYIDLDRFKAVNDTLGHAAGDQLLVTISQRLSCCVRASDTLARIGGDEFAALLLQLSTEEDAIMIAERIIESVAAPVLLGSDEVQVGASVGISFLQPHGSDAKTLHGQADLALYTAKKSGRGAYRVFSAPDSKPSSSSRGVP